MSMEDVSLVETRWVEHGDSGRVAEISVNRPAKINVLNRRAIVELHDAFIAVSAEADLRCVVLTGVGERAFIGGADISEMAELNPESARTFITALHTGCQVIRDCRVPVIARINGYCLGAGMEVAAACDIRVSSMNARFGMPEVLVGIPSVIEAVLLPRLIGWGKTSELLLTGKTISAEEAQEIRFTEQLVEVGSLDEAVGEMVGGILKAGPRSIVSQKALMRSWEGITLDEGIEAGIDAFEEAFRSDEPSTYMERFLNR